MLQRLLILCSAWLLWCSSIAFAKAPMTVIEAAPLQGVLGQVAVRAEREFHNNIQMGIQFENRPIAGERKDRSDLYRKISLEAVKYPGMWQLDGLFLSAGLGYEQASIARMRERDYVSTIRYTEDERYDQWVNEDQNFSAHLGVGYRFFLAKHFTASLRYVHDSLLYTYSDVHRENVYSFDPDLSSHGRPRQQGRLSFFAGLTLD